MLYIYSEDGKLNPDKKVTSYLYDENGKWISTREPDGSVVPAEWANVRLSDARPRRLGDDEDRGSQPPFRGRSRRGQER